MGFTQKTITRYMRSNLDVKLLIRETGSNSLNYKKNLGYLVCP